jgi:imidazolonepropionase-like amidohydrolase
MVVPLIENEHILAMTGRGVGLIENRSITVEDGKIVKVGKWHEASRTYSAS